MISPPIAADMCRRAAARNRKSVADVRDDMATNDYWACDHSEATESEIYTAGVVDGLGGEAGDFAGSWTPSAALATADVLDHAAVLIGRLPADAEMPSLLSLAVRLAEAFGGSS